MRAILLAAGLGTRLRPLTNTTPKCLVPLAGKPLLQIWLERLSEAGVEEFLINTHYLPEKVESFVKGSPFADRVRLVHERELLNTAGTLIQNLDFFQGGDGLLIHADNYCEANFREFIRAHRNRPSECLMTMMTFATDEPSSCGIVELDTQGVVVGFHEKVETPPGNLANGAIYVISSECAELIREELSAATDFSREVIPRLIERIHTYEATGLFADIGTTAAYERVKALVARSTSA